MNVQAVLLYKALIYEDPNSSEVYQYKEWFSSVSGFKGNRKV